MPHSDYIWHSAPDGGACFQTNDGGWIYVSNSELGRGQGGAGALRFNDQADVIDAYSILNRTHQNCGGGATPWQSWLSCEERPRGLVWDCDPSGLRPAIARPALGLFKHEAVAVDPVRLQLYLTEDMPDGRLYRYTPDSIDHHSIPDLNSGSLEVARVSGKPEGMVEWIRLPDPTAQKRPTRYQIPGSTPFRGGEGITYYEGILFFTTKGDNRVWKYNIAAQKIEILYDIETHPTPVLSGVDNLTASQSGMLYVAEDGGNLQIVVISPDKRVFPIVEMVSHDDSELTGVAFNPKGDRLYFSSQRGTKGISSNGVTYEIRGPFT